MSGLLATERTATPYRWRWRVLGVVLLAGVMDLLDSTVMNVAAPSVRAGIGGSEATLQWLAAGYTLAFGVLLVVGGRLGDRWGGDGCSSSAPSDSRSPPLCARPPRIRPC